MKLISQKTARRTVRALAAVLSYALLFNQFAHAAKLPPAALLLQQTAPQNSSSPEASARDRLLSAHTVYIVNDGGDKHFPVDPVESELRLAAVLQSWGRFHIVHSLADADLVLQLHSSVSESEISNTDNTSSSIIYSPYFRLVIADPATLKPIWTISVPVRLGTRRKDKADRFTISANNLVSQLKLLLGEPLTKQETADLRQPAGSRIFAYTMLGLGAAVAIGGAIAFVHFRHQSEDDQRNFCIQNHFPNCPA